MLKLILGLFDFLFLGVFAVRDGPFAIIGGLVALFARMSIEQRGVLAFFVFIASVLAILASLEFLLLTFPSP
jgi:hypothetical protein